MKFVRRIRFGNNGHQLRMQTVGSSMAFSLSATACNAHFLWLAFDRVDGQTLPTETSTLMFFGESAVERSYHLPEKLTKVKIVHRSTAEDGSSVAMHVVDEVEFVGMRSNAKVASKGVIETSCTYGLYHGSLLTYFATSYLSDKPTDWLATGNSKGRRLELIPTVTDDNKAISLQVLWDGKPVSDAGASIVTPEAAAEKKKTDEIDQFVRISYDDPNDWETLPMETPIQGVPLVAHNGNVYRLGGLVARNEPSESDDLHSLSEASRFDTKSNQWESVTSLPRGRSSHDAVVIGDNVYVVGGWTLTGDDDGEWHDTMLVGDLSQEKIAWQSVAPTTVGIFDALNELR